MTRRYRVPVEAFRRVLDPSVKSARHTETMAGQNLRIPMKSVFHFYESIDSEGKQTPCTAMTVTDSLW